MSVNKRIEFILLALKQKGFRVKDICFRANKTHGTLRNYRTGERKPDFDFILSLKEMLPILDLNWFFTGEGTPFLDGTGADWQDQLNQEVADEDVLEPVIAAAVPVTTPKASHAMAMLAEVESSFAHKLEEIKAMLSNELGKLEGVINSQFAAKKYANC